MPALTFDNTPMSTVTLSSSDSESESYTTLVFAASSRKPSFIALCTAKIDYVTKAWNMMLALLKFEIASISWQALKLIGHLPNIWTIVGSDCEQKVSNSKIVQDVQEHISKILPSVRAIRMLKTNQNLSLFPIIIDKVCRDCEVVLIPFRCPQVNVKDNACCLCSNDITSIFFCV